MSQSTFLLALCVSLLLTNVYCCGGGSRYGNNGGNGNGGNGNNDAGNVGNSGNDPGAGNAGTPAPRGQGPLESKMGLTPSDAQGYDPSDKKDPGVREPGELECQFDGPCCWNNENTDKADWLLGTKEPDGKKYSKYFDTTPPDSPPYMFTGGTSFESTDRANFVSCPIECYDSSAPIFVTLDHSAFTEDVVLEVCWRKSGSSTLEKCVPVDGSPSATELSGVETPGQIVISARNLNDPSGSFAVIDGIFVDFEPCQEDTPSTTTDGDDEAMCAGQCTFDEPSSACTKAWKDGTTIAKEDIPKRYRDLNMRPFEHAKGFYGHGVNGPAKDDINDGFMATAIERNEAGALVLPVDPPGPRKAKISYFNSYEYCKISICTESLDDCVDSPVPETYAQATTFQPLEFDVPADAQQVIIVYSRREGEENLSEPPCEGAVDDVEFFDENGDPLC